MPVNFNITNQLASPAIYASSFATRPAPSFIGRLFVDTNTPSTGIYRDTGTVWVAIAGSAAEAQSLQNVCQIGNTTTTGVLITGQSAFGTQGGDPIGPIGDYTVSIGETSLLLPNNSLICQHNALFETNVFINTSVLCPLIIGGNTTTSTLTYKTTSGIGVTGADHLFVVGNNGATEAMRILNNANVLIGTTTDIGVKLSVNGTAAISTSLRTPLLIGGTTTTSTLTFKTTTGVGATGARHIFQVGNNGATEAMTILNNANVGIGTTAPAAPLDVNGTIHSRSGSILSNSFGGYSGGDVNFTTNTSGSANLIFITALNERMRITGGGSVGINTTTPAASSLLDVTSTTKGFLPPRMTTTQINAITTPAEGLIAYNATLSHLCVYQAGAWAKLSHSPM